MVFSDDFLHFLKIKKKIVEFHQNYLVALTSKCNICNSGGVWKLAVPPSTCLKDILNKIDNKFQHNKKKKNFTS